MKYASEHVGLLTSVHQWKPVPPDRFANLLHHYATSYCNRWGSEALHTMALILDRDATAVVYYRKSERGSGVMSPVLMTMEGATGKTLCFETTNAGFAVEPRAAMEVIRESAKWREGERQGRLKEVADLAVKATTRIMVFTPRVQDHDEVHAAFRDVGGATKSTVVHYGLLTDLSTLRPDTDLIWLHNAGQLGQAALNGMMGTIASAMGGRGCMAFTGHEPVGYPVPDGVPKIV